MICHGQGDARGDLHDSGCCFIAGAICPMRWYVDDLGNVYDSTRTLVDDLDGAIRSVFGVNNPNIRDDIKDFIGRQDGAGPAMFICTAAGFAARDHFAEFISPQGEMTDRAQFDLRWSEEFDVGGTAEVVGDAWEAQNKPRNWCTTYGPGEGHCCHREDIATNDARRANLTTTSVSVRSQASGAG